MRKQHKESMDNLFKAILSLENIEEFDADNIERLFDSNFNTAQIRTIINRCERNVILESSKIGNVVVREYLKESWDLDVEKLIVASNSISDIETKLKLFASIIMRSDIEDSYVTLLINILPEEYHQLKERRKDMPQINKLERKKKSQVPRKETDMRKLRQKAYQNTEWRKLREVYMHEHPLCSDCLGKGKVTPATSVHHIKSPFRGGEVNYNLLLDYNNLMSLCTECHGIRHAAEQGHKSNEIILEELDALMENMYNSDDGRDLERH